MPLPMGSRPVKTRGKKENKIGFTASLYYGLARHHIYTGLSYSIFDRAVHYGKTSAQLSSHSL